MDSQSWLADQFEQNRTHLRVLAYRILGSSHDADDAVQEAWLRLSRSNAGSIENLNGWLSTVVGRICLDVLRARRGRREESLDAGSSEEVGSPERNSDPEQQALVAESVGLALLLVLDTLPPPERVAFVLHDVFGLSFDEIAPVVERSPVATRQLASRARRRIRGTQTSADSDISRQRQVVEAFFAAARGDNFAALLELLDPDAVTRADSAAGQTGATELRGAPAIAAFFAGRARAARPALVNGAVGAVWTQGGRPRVFFGFTIIRGKIAEIDLIADPDRLGQMDWSRL